MLRTRAVVWAAITLVALALPWTRQYCDTGDLAVVAAVAAAAVAAAALLVLVLRRSRGWVRRHALADVAVCWPLLTVGAVGEEVLFRGVLLRLVASWWGAWSAVLLSAAVFGAAHRPNRRSRDAVVHVFTGLVLGTIAWLTAGWLAGAAVHVAYNCVAFEWGPARALAGSGAPVIEVS